MVGIWGSAGIGKTTIARAVFSNLSSQFQRSVFIDRAFISKSIEAYGRANLVDCNMKLRLRENFLSEILDKKNMKVGAMEERLKRQKVLIIIDDLDDQYVLEALAGQTKWFGSGSRIIGVTTNKHLLKAHGIDYIYEVDLPSDKLALEMFCQAAFKQDSPPDGLMEFASEVVKRAGNLPLGLNVLGLTLRGLNMEDCLNMLPRFQRSLDGRIEETLRVSYDGLGNKEDKAIFRHIACLFNYEEAKDIKLYLANSDLDVSIGLKNLVDKSLIQVRWGKVEMHRLLQEMGRNIVCIQSTDEPEKREFLVDSKDICDVLNENIVTKKILGISLDIDKINELLIHESAFKRMHNLHFLIIYSKKYMIGNEGRLQLPKSFDYLPPRLRLLCWPEYPMRCMPSKFCPENLVKLKLQWSKLEKLWERVSSLTCLRKMNLWGSAYLKEIPDLSKATNLEKLDLTFCQNLVELPFSIRNLSKLTYLDMRGCTKLETLPYGIYLKALDYLNFMGCSRLRSFPEFSTNISALFLDQTTIEEFPSDLCLEYLIELSMTKFSKQWEGVQLASPALTELWLSDIPSLVELPSSFQSLNKLKKLSIIDCKNLETLPTGINFESLDLSGCSRLSSFPGISNNISRLYLKGTGIKEVPWWIQKFSKLKYLNMKRCSKLEYADLNISKMKHLLYVSFAHCGALNRAELSGYPKRLAMEADRIDTESPVPKEDSTWLSDNYIPKVKFDFINCFNLDRDALLHQQTVFEMLLLSGEEVPSFFTHRTSETSLTNIPLLQTSLSETSFRFRACVVLGPSFEPFYDASIKVCCRFRCKLSRHFDSAYKTSSFSITKMDRHLVIFDCCLPLTKENAPIPHPNYDEVDIQFQAIDRLGRFRLAVNGCGILVAADCTSYLDNSNILPHIREGDETSGDNLGGHEFESSEEWDIDTDQSVDSVDSVDTRRNSKQKQVVSMRHNSILRCSENLVNLRTQGMKSEKLLEGVQPPFSMVPNVKIPCFSNISSLVEVQNLSHLTNLSIRGCRNLETLPTGINLESLYQLDLSGCTRLKSFPDISTNISRLYLARTGIEEVPWWIEKFAKLKYLTMENCNKLKYVSLNICKLKHFENVDFSDCKSLAEASWRDCPSAVGRDADNIHSYSPVPEEEASSSPPNDFVPKIHLRFANCIKLNQEALIQQESVFELMFLPVEEVPSYFTHRTTGTSLNNIPLFQTSLSQPYFKFRACVLLSSFGFNDVYIKVYCRVKGRIGNHYDSTDQTRSFSVPDKTSHLAIFDCGFHLKKDNALPPHLNYNQVDIQFQVTNRVLSFAFKGCGIRLPGDCTPYPDNPNTLPHVPEGSEIKGDKTESSVEWEDNIDTDLGNESNQSGECRDSDVGTRRSSKRMRVKMMGRLKKLLTCFAFKPQDTSEDATLRN